MTAFVLLPRDGNDTTPEADRAREDALATQILERLETGLAPLAERAGALLTLRGQCRHGTLTVGATLVVRVHMVGWDKAIAFAAWEASQFDPVEALVAEAAEALEGELRKLVFGAPGWRNGLDEAVRRLREVLEQPGRPSLDARDRHALRYVLDRVVEMKVESDRRKSG